MHTVCMKQELSGTFITKINNLLDISGAKLIMNQCLMGPSAAKGLLTPRIHFPRVGQVFLSSQTFILEVGRMEYPRKMCPLDTLSCRHIFL